MAHPAHVVRLVPPDALVNKDLRVFQDLLETEETEEAMVQLVHQDHQDLLDLQERLETSV